MPDLNYMAPYTSLGNTVQGLGNDMGTIALRLSQARYMNAIRQQQIMMQAQRMYDQQKNEAARLAIAQQTMKDRQALQAEQMPYYQAGVAQRNASAAVDQGKLDSADRLAGAVRMMNPVDMSQGPTAAGARQLTQGDVMENAARSMALSGKAGELIMPHNIPPNYIAINPLTQELMAQGLLQLAPGHISQLPGGPQIQAPSYGNVPPGNIRVENATGKEVAKNDKIARPNPINLGNLYGSMLGTAQDVDPGVLDLTTKALSLQLQQMTNQHPATVVGPPPGSPQGGKLRQDAISAISQGADPAAVRKAYVEMTGMPADF